MGGLAKTLWAVPTYSVTHYRIIAGVHVDARWIAGDTRRIRDDVAELVALAPDSPSGTSARRPRR